MALNHIAQNTETADEFLNGITELMQELVARYQGISEEKKNQFQGKAKGEVIGKCPRCGADVREMTWCSFDIGMIASNTNFF